MDATHHRAGKLKQQNKAHKSKAKSKRETKKYLAVGTSQRPRSASQASTASTKSGSVGRAERRNKATALRKEKRNALIMRRRMGGGHAAPRVVCVVNLSPTAGEPIQNFSRSVAKGVVQHNAVEETHTFADKSRITYIDMTDERDPIRCLDACKVADIVLFVVALRTGENQDEIEIKSTVTGGLSVLLSAAIDERGRELVSLFKAQGLPTSVGAIQGLDKVPVKHRAAVKRNLMTFFEDEFSAGVEVKVLDLKTEAEDYVDSSKAIVRALSEVALRTITWRSERSYLLGVEKRLSADGERVVAIRGHLRGRPLSVHQLIHVTGQGTFQLNSISFPEDPTLSKADIMERETIMADPAKVPSLKEEAEVDPLMGEQTWPDRAELGDDEMEAEDEKGSAKKRSGTMDIESGDEDKKSKSDRELDPGKEYLKAWGVDVEEDEDDFDWGGKPLNKPARSKAERAKMDLEFPDEMDTPFETPARERFAAYRGLKSFRTSPWHPTESLPREYGYIHQLKNYKQAQKLVLEQQADIESNWVNAGVLPHGYVEPGSYIELQLQGEGFHVANCIDPIVAGALLPHEHQLSLLNCMIQPRATDAPVECRDDLELHVGFWRRPVRPVFSEPNLNSDKHKMERFLEPNRWTVSSSYAPITFGTNVPALLFRIETGELAGTGYVLDVNPNRIILKKVVLSGFPFRIKKRWAVVRKMFYNPEDVAWFRPVELYTKYGASGRILESVGTHGSMKCQFDRVINQRDTVCMSLYKRVYPRRVPGMFPEIEEDDDDVLSDTEERGS